MITLMDGGMGDELAKRGSGSKTGLWSAKALIEAPNEVKAVHLDFIKSGARMITTNSYSTIPSYLQKEGMENRFEELAGLAGKLAREAAHESGRKVLVFGSLPPLGESYRADLAPREAQSRPIYDVLARALHPYVDGFVCETMSTSQEARSAVSAACSAAEGTDLKVYVSWTLKETPGRGLRSGESIKSAFEALSALPIDAYLFNCTHPLAIETGLRQLKEMTQKPLGAYANTMAEVPEGWTLDTGSIGRRDEGTALYAEAAMRWVREGATLIGGCCGVGPEHIEVLAERLAKENTL